MKAEEKALIFNLLKTADAYTCGYTRDKFSSEISFQDDIQDNVIKNTTSEETIKTEVKEISVIYHEEDTKVSTDSIPVSVEKTSKSGITLDELNAKILRCTRCGLARTRNNVVPGMGVTNPEVMVIGEGPGYDEDMKGLPFVGKAGMLLDKMLNAIQLDRNTNCYIANVVKCRPPENRNPFPDEQSSCFLFLETQIHILKPKMILCMGKISIEKLLNQSISINQSHGEFFEYNGIPVMATYHPSALLRNEELKRPAWEDLKKFRVRLNDILRNNP